MAGAKALAHYDHPHFGLGPAVTTTEHGRGRITYVGTVPDAVLGRAVFEWTAPYTERARWTGLPDSATATSNIGRAGKRVHFVPNWSWTPTRATAPCPLTDAVAQTKYAQGDSISLAAWDVRILVEN